MNKTSFSKLLSLIVCITLITAMAFFASSCSDDTTNTTTAPDTTVSDETTQISDETTSSDTPESTVVGEGNTQFTFVVIDADSNETYFTVCTDKTTVGEALTDAKLIDGEEGPYGLYVKTVNGITLDYDTDGKYWAFYINGSYASSSVDLTNIDTADTYAFKAE